MSISTSVVTNFKSMRNELSGLLYLPYYKREVVNMERFVMKKKLKVDIEEPENPIRKFIFKIVQNQNFESIMLVLLLINILSISVFTQDQSSSVA